MHYLHLQGQIMSQANGKLQAEAVLSWTEFRDLSLRANYTDQAIATCQLS
jgi:hypothetical protein